MHPEDRARLRRLIPDTALRVRLLPHLAGDILEEFREIGDDEARILLETLRQDHVTVPRDPTTHLVIPQWTQQAPTPPPSLAIPQSPLPFAITPAQGSHQIGLSNYIIILQACPLVFYLNSEQDLKPVPPLDLEYEEAGLDRAAQDAHRNSHGRIPRIMQFDTGNIENLGNALSEGYSVLHLSGHGEVPPKMEPFLLFETTTNDAMGEKVTNARLKEVLKPFVDSMPLKCVVLSTCHSKSFIQPFIDAKVPCIVYTSTRVRDDMAKAFNRVFYKTVLLSQDQEVSTFSRAFDLAKSAVSAMADSPAQVPFLFYPPTTASLGARMPSLTLESPSSTPILTPATSPAISPYLIQPGYVDTQYTEVPMSKRYVSKLKAKVSHFFGRAVEMYEVIRLISKERFVAVKGSIGMGKSAVLRSVALYLDNRKHWRGIFEHGIYFIDLQNVTSLEGLITALLKSMKAQRRSDSEVMAWLDTDLKFVPLDNLVDQLVDVHTLLFMDNCDEIPQKGEDSLKTFFDQILNACAHVQIVCASRRELPQPDGQHGVTYELKKLSDDDSLHLLQKVARRAIRSEVSSVEKDQYQRLIERMSGHPASVVYTGHLLAKSDMTHVIDSLDRFQFDDRAAEEGFEHLFSLLSAEYDRMSLQNREMYHFLGMLPDGADIDVLHSVFGMEKWRLAIHALVDLSVALKISNNTSPAPAPAPANSQRLPRHDSLGIDIWYRLSFSFNIEHANKTVYDRTNLHLGISNFLSKQCDKAHQDRFLKDNKGRKWLQNNEKNIWACLSYADGNVTAENEAFNSNYLTDMLTLATTFAELLRMSERKKDSEKAIQYGLTIGERLNQVEKTARCYLVSCKNHAELRDAKASQRRLLRALVYFRHMDDRDGYNECLYLTRVQEAGMKDFQLTRKDSALVNGTLAKEEEYLLPTLELVKKDLECDPLATLDMVIASRTGPPWLRASCLVFKAKLLLKTYKEGDVEIANQVTQLLEEASQTEDLLVAADAVKVMGDLAKILKNLPRAIERFEQAASKYTECDALTPKANTLRDLGLLLKTQAEELYKTKPPNMKPVAEFVQKSAKQYNDARETFKKCLRTYGQSVTLRLYGELVMWTSQHEDIPIAGRTPEREEDALNTFLKALKLKEAKPTVVGVQHRFLTYQNMLTVYSARFERKDPQVKAKAAALYEEIEKEWTDVERRLENLDRARESVQKLRAMKAKFELE